MARPALIVIDMLNHFDFEGGAALARASEGIAPRILRLRERFDRAGAPVIYANDNWMHWRGEFQDLVAACRAAGGTPARLADKLEPTRDHYYVLKPERSALQFSALPVLLRQLSADQLVLAGVTTDACVLATATDAYMRGYRLWIPSDCTSAETPKRKASALRLARESLQASTRSTRLISNLFPTE